MNPELQGKLMVAMLISILAFGMGTAAVLISGQYKNINTISTMNTTKQSDFPVVPSSTQNNLNSSSSQPSNTTNNNPINNNNNNNNTTK
jgi:hypothetical protein